MPCTPFDIPGLGRGILCSRTRTPRCGCGRPSAFQCDAPSKRMCGNSVCPPLAEALVAANYSERQALRQAA